MVTDETARMVARLASDARESLAARAVDGVVPYSLAGKTILVTPDDFEALCRDEVLYGEVFVIAEGIRANVYERLDPRDVKATA